MKSSHITCPKCHRKLKVPSEKKIVRARCRFCGETITPEKITLSARHMQPSRPPALSRRGAPKRKPTSRGRTAHGSRSPAPEKQEGNFHSAGKSFPVGLVVAGTVGTLAIILAVFFLILPKHQARQERLAKLEREQTEKRRVDDERRAKADAEAERLLSIVREQKTQEKENKTNAPALKTIRKKDYTVKALPHLEQTDGETRDRIDTLIQTLLDLALTRESIRAGDELGAIGVPAIPRLLGSLSTLDMDDLEHDVLQAKIVTQVLKDITGVEKPHWIIFPIGDDVATVGNRERILRLWFGWWSVNKYEIAGFEGESKSH